MLISLHGILTIEMDDALPWKQDLVEMFGDSALVLQDDEPDVQLKVVFQRHLTRDGMRPMGDGVFMSPGCVLDAAYGVRLAAFGQGPLVIETTGPAQEWLIWAAQLVLLASGVTLVHGAGLARSGRAVLFPSWGGVGKTTIVGGLVGKAGWRLLGDDMVMLSQKGECFGLAKPMVVYPYHREVFPQLFRIGRGPLAPSAINGLLGTLAQPVKRVLRMSPGVLQFARRHNPQSVRVRPSTVFGRENLSTSARLTSVVWLERIAGLQDIQLAVMRNASAVLCSRMFGSTVSEFDQRCIRSTGIALGAGVFDVFKTLNRWLEVLQDGISPASKYTLKIPADMPNDRMMAAVQHVIEHELAS